MSEPRPLTAEEEAALREHVAGILPGPYGIVYTEGRDPEEWAAECARLTREHADANGLPQQPMWSVYAGPSWEEGLIVATTGNGPTSERHAEAIAWLLSALPHLLADPALNVERLARALDACLPEPFVTSKPGNRVRAKAIAREYAALGDSR